MPKPKILSKAETRRAEKALHEAFDIFYHQWNQCLEDWQTLMKPIFDWLEPIRAKKNEA